MATKNNKRIFDTAGARTGTEPAVIRQTTAQPEQAAPKSYAPRNIKFVGRVIKDRAGKIIRNDAPVTRTAGAQVILLPDADTQRHKRVFWHEQAAEIVALFPAIYKIIRGKGDKR